MGIIRFHCYILYFIEGGSGIFEKKTFQKLVVRDSLHLDRQKFITVFMCIFYMYIYFYDVFYLLSETIKTVLIRM